MSIYQPYFYIIQDSRNGIYYAGSKWAKNSNPKTLLKLNSYTTSSKTINSIIEKFGIETFIIRKIKLFKTDSEAYNYETKFLQKVNARNNDKFYNGHNNDGYVNPEYMKNYMLEKYGVEHNTKLKSTIEKRKESIDNKYGSFSNMMKETGGNQKSLESCRKNNGVSTPFQLPEVREKAFKTNMKRYGGKSPLSCPEVREKAKINRAINTEKKSLEKNNSIKEKILTSNIDFSKRGWIGKLSLLLNKEEQCNIPRWMIKYMPEFYFKHCKLRKKPART